MKTSQLKLYTEVIAVCSQIHTKQINTLCEQNTEILNVKAGGAYSNHWALQGQRVNTRCVAQNNEKFSLRNIIHIIRRYQNRHITSSFLVAYKKRSGRVGTSVLHIR